MASSIVSKVLLLLTVVLAARGHFINKQSCRDLKGLINMNKFYDSDDIDALQRCGSCCQDKLPPDDDCDHQREDGDLQSYDIEFRRLAGPFDHQQFVIAVSTEYPEKFYKTNRICQLRVSSCDSDGRGLILDDHECQTLPISRDAQLKFEISDLRFYCRFTGTVAISELLNSYKEIELCHDGETITLGVRAIKSTAAMT